MIYLNVHGASVLLGKFIEQDLKSNGNLGVSLRKHISSFASLLLHGIFFERPFHIHNLFPTYN